MFHYFFNLGWNGFGANFLGWVGLTGVDPGGGRWGGRPPLRRSNTSQNTTFSSIQAPVNN